jgi:hypothetical protein
MLKCRLLRTNNRKGMLNVGFLMLDEVFLNRKRFSPNPKGF